MSASDVAAPFLAALQLERGRIERQMLRAAVERHRHQPARRSARARQRRRAGRRRARAAAPRRMSTRSPTDDRRAEKARQVERAGLALVAHLLRRLVGPEHVVLRADRQRQAERRHHVHAHLAGTLHEHGLAGPQAGEPGLQAGARAQRRDRRAARGETVEQLLGGDACRDRPEARWRSVAQPARASTTSTPGPARSAPAHRRASLAFGAAAERLDLALQTLDLRRLLGALRARRDRRAAPTSLWPSRW